MFLAVIVGTMNSVLVKSEANHCYLGGCGVISIRGALSG